jgi:carbonic anhydrase
VIPAETALQRLRDGNQRFIAGTQTNSSNLNPARSNKLVEGQEPFAIILGCSDSRVPVEMVFDQGFGDLFVIRVAGNIVAPSQIGSVEFAAQQFGVRLVVVLGHSNCGAVQATIDDLNHPQNLNSEDLYFIVNRIKPSVQPLMKDTTGQDQGRLLGNAVRANVRASAAELRSGSGTLKQLIRSGGLQVIGAEYSLETGEVAFFDGVSEQT